MIHIGEKKLPQELEKDNLTISLTKSASIGYFPAFFAFISRYVRFIYIYLRLFQKETTLLREVIKAP